MKKLTECRLNVPGSWAELSDEQKLFIAYLQVTYVKGEDLLTRALLFCSGLQLVENMDPVKDGNEVCRWYRMEKSKPFLIEHLQFTTMVRKMEFLILPPEDYRPLPKLRKAKAFHPKLYKATFEHYLMAENFFMAYTKTDKVEHLNALCAVLYKRKWQRWSSDKIKERAKYFSGVSLTKKITVYTWYASFRNLVAKECPNLNSPAKAGAEPKIKEVVKGMIRMLNKGDIKGNPAILKADLWDALYELEAQAKEYSQMKEKYGI